MLDNKYVFLDHGRSLWKFLNGDNKGTTWEVRLCVEVAKIYSKDEDKQISITIQSYIHFVLSKNE